MVWFVGRCLLGGSGWWAWRGRGREAGFELTAAEVAPVVFEFVGRRVLLGENAGEGGDDGLAGEGEFDGDVVGLEDGDEAGFFALVFGDVAVEGFALLAEEGGGGFFFADEPGLGFDGVVLGNEAGEGEGAEDEGVGEGGVDLGSAAHGGDRESEAVGWFNAAHIGIRSEFVGGSIAGN